MANTNPVATIFHSEARSLVSSVVGQEYTISVWLTASYAESDRTYPVLYVLDANVTFGMAADTATLLVLGEEIPEILVVGIGYPIKKYEDWFDGRRRDLTPSMTAERPGSGGADRFLAFIRTELIPFIDTNYRVDSNDRTLWGYSDGGLFVLYALFSEPGLFRRYAACSPSINWDEEFLLKVEAEYAASHKALPARLFMSAGSLEEEYATLMRKAEAILTKRNYEGLDLTVSVFDGETHMSGVSHSFVRGVKSLFASDLA